MADPYAAAFAAPPPLLADLWPLTGSYAFIDSPLEDVRSVLEAWRHDLARRPRSRRVAGRLRQLLQSLTPMSLGYRELLLPTDSPWTAYFEDGLTGADIAPVSELARRLGCRAIHLTRWPVPGYEALQFQLMADHPTDFLNFERVVSVARDDGRWTFDLTGDPQPFEHPEAYRADRIEDRFTPALMDEYCQALGVRPFDVGFFGEKGTLVSSEDPKPGLRFSIRQQQARYSYQPLIR